MPDPLRDETSEFLLQYGPTGPKPCLLYATLQPEDLSTLFSSIFGLTEEASNSRQAICFTPDIDMSK